MNSAAYTNGGRFSENACSAPLPSNPTAINDQNILAQEVIVNECFLAIGGTPETV